MSLKHNVQVGYCLQNTTTLTTRVCFFLWDTSLNSIHAKSTHALKDMMLISKTLLYFLDKDFERHAVEN